MTAADDGTARIWSATTGDLLQTLSDSERNPVYNAAFSSNGRLVVACSGATTIIWDAQTGQQLTQIPYGNSLSDCEFSPDGSEVVTAGDDGQIRILSAELAGDIKKLMKIAAKWSAQPLTAAEQKKYDASSS